MINLFRFQINILRVSWETAHSICLLDAQLRFLIRLTKHQQGRLRQMFDESTALSIIDDTKPLTATISSTENNGSFIVSKISIYLTTHTDI